MPKCLGCLALALPLALNFAIPSASQAANCYAGAKGGINIAELTGDGADDSDTKNGFIGGGFYGVNFSRYLGARFEALAVEKGAKGSIVTPGDDHPHEAEWTLTYIDLPIVLTANIPVGSRLALNAFAGPSFNFNVKSEIRTTHGLVDLDPVSEVFELGSAFGGGLEYRFTNWSMFAEGRYTLGLQTITDVPDVDIKNRGIAAMVGLSFAVGP